MKNYKHKITKEEFELLKPLCNCPDHEEIPWREHYKYSGIPQYVFGHQRKGKKNSEYQTKKIVESRKGKKLTEEHKNKIINSRKGHKSSKETKKRISLSRIGKHYPKLSESKKGKPSKKKGKPQPQTAGPNNPFYGKHHTEESKQKISLANKGRLSPMKGKHNLKLQGDKNPAWKGGITKILYCDKFNDILKEAVRNRDSRLCQLCNKTEIENGRKQSVHHIHYLKEDCYPDLITLCISCNTKVNKNRDFWEELFTFMLWIRGMLYWKPD